MIIYAIVSLIFVAGGFVVLSSAKQAPEGYEDADGFHPSAPLLVAKVSAENSSGSAVRNAAALFPVSA